MVPGRKDWDLFTNAQVPGWSFEWTACGEAARSEALLELQTNGVDRPGPGRAASTSNSTPTSAMRPATRRIFGSTAISKPAMAPPTPCSYSWAKRHLGRPDEGFVGRRRGADHARRRCWHRDLERPDRQLEGNGTTLRLEFEEVGPPDSLGMFLDVVSLRVGVPPVRCPTPRGARGFHEHP